MAQCLCVAWRTVGVVSLPFLGTSDHRIRSKASAARKTVGLERRDAMDKGTASIGVPGETSLCTAILTGTRLPDGFVRFARIQRYRQPVDTVHGEIGGFLNVAHKGQCQIRTGNCCRSLRIVSWPRYASFE
jgi:hypothetical protein